MAQGFDRRLARIDTHIHFICPQQIEEALNSGVTTMSAIRLARGFTGRDNILKFEGCYHGHSDSLLVKAGSGLLTQGVPSSAGVPADFGFITVARNG